MSADNHAHYARIGFTVVVGVAAIAATLVYLGGFHDAKSEILVETYSDIPVTGLSVGSPVNLYGLKIGEVREISFAMRTYEGRGADSNDYNRVSVVLALNKRALSAEGVTASEAAVIVRERVAQGMRATLQSNGITGLTRVDLRVVENPPPLDQLGWRPRYPLIPPSPSLFDNFSVAATKLMNRLKTMNFDVVWSNVNRIADAAACATERADAMLEESRGGVRQSVTDISAAAATFKELAGELRENPSLLIRARDPEPLEETTR